MKNNLKVIDYLKKSTHFYHIKTQMKTILC